MPDRNDTQPVSPDPGDVRAVVDYIVSRMRGRDTDAEKCRALEAYTRACAAEARRRQAAIARQCAREIERYRRQHPDEAA